MSLFIDLANYKYLWVVLIAIAQLRTVAQARFAQARAVPPPAAARPTARPLERYAHR